MTEGRALKTILVHLLMGSAAGTLVLVALLAMDIGGIRAVLSGEGARQAFVILFVLNALTFGAVFAGIAALAGTPRGGGSG